MKPFFTLLIVLFLSAVNGRKYVFDPPESDLLESSLEKELFPLVGQVTRSKRDDQQTLGAPLIQHRYQKPKRQTYSTKKIIKGLNKHGLDSGLNLNVQIVCNERGYFKDPVNPDCNTFLMCDITATGDLFAYTLTCPKGWLYNPKKGFCSPFYKCE